MTNCSDCGKPWGVIVNEAKPHRPTEANRPSQADVGAARAEMVEILLTEVWDCQYDEGEVEGVDPDLLPPVTVDMVVYISDAKADFAAEHSWSDWGAEGGLWYILSDVDFPGWLLNGCKRRWCVKWACCDIGRPKAYHPASPPDEEKR